MIEFSFIIFINFYFVCIVLPFVDISYISVLSPVLSGLFPQVVLSIFPVLSFFVFLIIPASFFCFTILAYFRRLFLSEFLVEIPILVLIFLSYSLRGSQFSRKLISLLHELVHIIPLYYSLIYMSVLDSLYLSLP